MADVKGFGAVGDGVADDTNAIQHAVDQGDGLLELPGGLYRCR
jgi:polygalacturonase